MARPFVPALSAAPRVRPLAFFESSPSGPTALVLGSPGARGAYEVGVARYLLKDLRRELGYVPRLDILCGTSAGALNALGLAAYADQPLEGLAFLECSWRGLDVGEIVRPRHLPLLRLTRAVLQPFAAIAAFDGAESFLDPRPFRTLLGGNRRLASVGRRLSDGHLAALALTTTDVATGRTTVFVQRGRETPLPSSGRALAFSEVPHLGLRHALAAASVPLLFTPVRIRGRLYCDGSLHQAAPLAPAVQLGAGKLIVVSTKSQAAFPSVRLGKEREGATARPLYLLGKAVDALTLDRVDEDLSRLRAVNGLLEAGREAFGEDFLPEVNERLQGRGERPLRSVQAVAIHPSESLGRLAADHIRGQAFRARTQGSLSRLFGRLCEAESDFEADLASYLLFDGDFAAKLIELGYDDACRRADVLAALLEPEAGPATAGRA